VYFAAVEEIENLHHNECVEDEGEVSRIDAVAVVDCLVVRMA
jgi:hypothetical protein